MRVISNFAWKLGLSSKKRSVRNTLCPGDMPSAELAYGTMATKPPPGRSTRCDSAKTWSSSECSRKWRERTSATEPSANGQRSALRSRKTSGPRSSLGDWPSSPPTPRRSSSPT